MLISSFTCTGSIQVSTCTCNCILYCGARRSKTGAYRQVKFKVECYIICLIRLYVELSTQSKQLSTCDCVSKPSRQSFNKWYQDDSKVRKRKLCWPYREPIHKIHRNACNLSIMQQCLRRCIAWDT